MSVAGFPTSLRPRITRLAAQGSRFAALQLSLQAATAITGIFLVWVMDKREYAFYTVAAQFVSALAVLSDSGVSASLLTLAGKRWPDMDAVGSTVVAAIEYRRKLALLFGAVLVPMMLWALARQATGTPYALLLTVVVLTTAFLQLNVVLLGAVPRLSGNFTLPQRADLGGALLRLLLLAALVVLLHLRLNALLALAVGLLGTLLTVAILRRFVGTRINLRQVAAKQDLAAIGYLTRSQIAGAIFYCIQGQIAIWIIAFVGNASAIADVGALSRLAVAFNVVTALMTLVIAPRISKSRSQSELMKNTGLALAVQLAFSLPALFLAWRFPGLVLLVLGPKYRNLQDVVFIMVVVSVAASTAATLWTIVSSRGWVKHSWISIPLVIATQLLVARWTDFRTVRGVLTFNAIAMVPNLAVFLVLLIVGMRNSSRAQLAITQPPEG